MLLGSTDLLGANVRWLLIGKVDTPDERSHVTPEFDDQTRLMDDQRAVNAALGLRLNRLLKFFEMRSQQLLHIRNSGSPPGDGKDFSG